MPPKAKIKKEMVINKAFEITGVQGAENVMQEAMDMDIAQKREQILAGRNLKREEECI